MWKAVYDKSFLSSHTQWCSIWALPMLIINRLSSRGGSCLRSAIIRLPLEAKCLDLICPSHLMVIYSLFELALRGC